MHLKIIVVNYNAIFHEPCLANNTTPVIIEVCPTQAAYSPGLPLNSHVYLKLVPQAQNNEATLELCTFAAWRQPWLGTVPLTQCMPLTESNADVVMGVVRSIT